MATTNADKLELYRAMRLIREFEKKLDYLFKRGLVKGTCHLSIGQEAVPVALCDALEASDYATGTHRGHGLALAKGVDPTQLMAEVMGRANGLCGGRGGSQHTASAEKNFIGTNGITGGGLALAAGAALACAHRGDGRIVAVALGDGATNQGSFHETLNIAALWNLPVLFVCENNLYGMSTHIERASSEPLLWKRAAAYNMESSRVEGNDLEQLLGTFRDVVDFVRTERRPAFVECMTYRWMGHSKSDPRLYRTREEEAAWRKKCPIQKWAAALKEQGASDDELRAVDADVTRVVEQAAERSNAAAPAAPEELYEHVWAD
jgi:pyruvate dehydrogenase E1 component alpha subunit